MNMDEADADLIRKIIGGDTDLFRNLVLKYQRRIFRLHCCLAENREEAADLTQETFIQAFRGLSSFRGESTFYTWIYRIALNNVFRAAVKKRRLSSCVTFNTAATDEAMDALAETFNVDPLKSLEEKELLLAIDRALDELPERLGAIFLLRVLDDLSYSAIADIQAIPLNTVRSRLWRARTKLSKKLAIGPDDQVHGTRSHV